MDYGFFKFLEGLQRSIHILQKTMSVLVSRLKAVIEYFQNGEATLKAELAATKEALAAALTEGVADDEAIEVAQAEAAAARDAADAAAAKVAELQSLVDADTEEDSAIGALLDSVVIPEPEVIEPAPEAPAEIEAPTSEPEVIEG